ncbi:hypothetical protein ACA910_011166 [Epithemia clementina (nom. ined.)]
MANRAQQMALALVPKFSASVGLPSAALLSYYIGLDHVNGKANPMLRALWAVSVYELLDALAWFVSTWAAPRGTDWVLWASGTQASCSWQGFYLQFVIGAPLSNCAMAFYFYMVVLHQKTPHDLKRIERFLLTGIFAYAFGSAILLLVMDQYNPIGAVCYAQGSPPLCGNSVYTPNPDVPCERGDWAWVYGMVLFYIPLWICYLSILYFNSVIYWHIRSTPQASWFATQSLLYGLAFGITWAPSTMWSAWQWNDGGSFWLDLASTIFEPLAGFWNLCIFLQNRPKTRQELKQWLCYCHCCCWNNTNSSDSTATSAKKPESNDRSKSSSLSSSPSVIIRNQERDDNDDDEEVMSDEPRAPRGVLKPGKSPTSASAQQQQPEQYPQQLSCGKTTTKTSSRLKHSSTGNSHGTATSTTPSPPPESVATATRRSSSDSRRSSTGGGGSSRIAPEQEPTEVPASGVVGVTTLEQCYYSAAAAAAIANPIGQTIPGAVLGANHDGSNIVLVALDGRPRRAHYHNKHKTSTTTTTPAEASSSSVAASPPQAPPSPPNKKNNSNTNDDSLPKHLSNKNPRYEMTERKYNSPDRS